MHTPTEHAYQRLWGQSLVRLSGLRSDMGHQVDVVRTGLWNRHAGPDFLDARVLIDGRLFCGSIEVHLNPGEWYYHGHHRDAEYNSVVLHASPKASGRPIMRQDGTRIPHVVVPFGAMEALKPPSGRSNRLACSAVLGGRLDALGRALEVASCRYFEELTERHLQVVRNGLDPATETARALFVRACSVLGAPLNRESMSDAAKIWWDAPETRGCHFDLGSVHDHTASKNRGGRPATLPAVRTLQALQILGRMQGADFTRLLSREPSEITDLLIAPSVGAATSRVIQTTVVIPALWAYATLGGRHDMAAQMRSLWDAAPLPASPEAAQVFAEVHAQVSRNQRKALTWQYRSMCSPRRCASCQVGIQLPS